MNNGQSQNLTVVPPLQFFGVVVVELFDQDVGGPFDPDDFLGVVTIAASQQGLGPQVASITGDGANYTLIYEIAP